jgi:hypothetical protein
MPGIVSMWAFGAWAHDLLTWHLRIAYHVDSTAEFGTADDGVRLAGSADITRRVIVVRTW